LLSDKNERRSIALGRQSEQREPSTRCKNDENQRAQVAIEDLRYTERKVRISGKEVGNNGKLALWLTPYA